MIETSAFALAQRWIGHSEIAGPESDPFVLAMLRLDAGWPKGDDVPWCSAFVNFIAWQLRLPRSHSLRARSWLLIGAGVSIYQAQVGCDVVVLSRGKGKQPGPDVIEAPGHVGFFAGTDHKTYVEVLGGNQGNAVSIARYPIERVLGVRRIHS